METLCIRFFHAFHNQGIFVGLKECPTAWNVEGIMSCQCTQTELHFSVIDLDSGLTSVQQKYNARELRDKLKYLELRHSADGDNGSLYGAQRLPSSARGRNHRLAFLSSPQ